jgi:DNA-binding MarR family transcriptional regulator
MRRCAFPDGNDLFPDPAWEMLLDLYINENHRPRVAVSSLCIAAKVPPTTALRWIDRLVTAQFLCRADDACDGRRVLLGLTAEGRRCVEAALDGAADGDRRLGVRRLELVQSVEPKLDMA